MQIPITTENLTKIYNLGKKGTKTAVNSLSIEVPEGVIFGFLGPNGAGKTTTIKMILDFVRPTRGKASIFEMLSSEAKARASIGYLPEQPYFHKFLTPMEVVSTHARLAGVPRNEISKRAMASLERTGIGDYAKTRIAKLSKGLTQRVGIAQALVGDPKLLILDEPTSGLDPIGRRHVRDLLIDLRNEGKTIFLSSHLLGEVENLCDLVAIMRMGNMVSYGTPEQVSGGSSTIKIHTSTLDKYACERIKSLAVSIDQGVTSAVVKVDPSRIYEVMRAMEELRISIIRMETEKESLEEAFLRLAA